MIFYKKTANQADDVLKNYYTNSFNEKCTIYWNTPVWKIGAVNIFGKWTFIKFFIKKKILYKRIEVGYGPYLD